MIEIIAWMVLVFGTLCVISVAKNSGMQAITVVVAFVFGGLLAIQGQNLRKQGDAYGISFGGPPEPSASERAQASFARADELVRQIQSDQARINELCAKYPGIKGC
jgi:hypothetical protein